MGIKGASSHVRFVYDFLYRNVAKTFLFKQAAERIKNSLPCFLERWYYMIKRMNDFLASLPMTIVGGVFLVMSFVFPRTGIVLPGNGLPFDPAWMTVMI